MRSAFASQDLIQMIGAVCLAGVLMWALVSELLRIAPAAARHFLAANLLLVLGVGLALHRAAGTSWPGGSERWAIATVPEWASWPLANCLVLGAFALCCRGLRRLYKIRRATWADKAMIAAACLGMAVPPVGPGSARSYAIVFSLAAAWHCAVMARDAWSGTASVLGRRVGAVLTTPLALGAILVASQPLRLATGETPKLTITDLTTLWGLLGMAVLLNLCFMLLVLARLVVVLRARAERDHLTGLYNRRRWETFLAHEWRRSLRHPPGLCLVMLDVDHFKRINDTLGHAAGDAALRHVALTLRETCRTSDITARVGGEEFAVILPATSLAGGHEQAERLRTALASSRFEYAGTRHAITVSLGVAFSKEAEHEDDLCRRADMALYAAKAAGRNCVKTDQEVPAEAPP